jgi:chemotaxis protein MotA
VLDLVQDLVALIGLLAAAVGAGGIALVLARQFGLDAQLLRCSLPRARSPERTLEMMLACADIAAREGILKLETHAATLREPLLSRGIALAMEGRSGREMRELLDAAVESAAGSGAARARLLMVAGLGAQIAGILIASLLTAACIYLAAGASGAVSGMLMLVGGTVGLLSIVAGSLWSDAAGMTRATDALCDLIIAEGVLLLRAGRDPRSIAQALSRFLPPQDSPSLLARAA